MGTESGCDLPVICRIEIGAPDGAPAEASPGPPDLRGWPADCGAARAGL